MGHQEKDLPQREEDQRENGPALNGEPAAQAEALAENAAEPLAGEAAEDAAEAIDAIEEAAEDAAETEAPAEPAAPPKRRRGSGEKWKRGGAATLMSVVFIAIVVAVNILVGLLTDRFPSLNIDLTAQRLNSLSDQALEIARSVSQDTSIYLIGAEDSYRKNRLYSSYGLEFSQVANLAEKLREANGKIQVAFVDPDTNPQFISDHAEDSLSSGCVVVETAKRHKTLYPDDLFSVTTNRTTYAQETYSKVDSALAGALELVNLEKVPLLTLATGHSEMLTADVLSSFTEMIEDQNFEVRQINLLTDPIPEETQILMIPTPTTDYTEEEIQKLQDYLNQDDRAEDLALLVTCHATQGSLPRLSNFLEEWGIRVESGAVAESDDSRIIGGTPTTVLVDPQVDQILSGNTYNNVVTAASSPLTVLFSGNGDVATNTLWKTSDSAYVITEDMTALPEAPETSAQTVAAIGAKFIHINNQDYRHSVVVFGSSYVFTSTFINASAYGDRQYLSDLARYCAGTDASAVTVMPTQVQTHPLDISASSSLVNLLGIGVFSVGLPLVILVAGLAIFLKRRHL